jgi:BlaI family transcriptional regulator, penicillinase repressor
LLACYEVLRTLDFVSGKKCNPTDSELAILQVLWRRGPSTVREIRDELGQATGYTTVLKFLQIMLEKKLVTRDEGRMTHVYEAADTETNTQERLLDSLIHRAFSGSSSQLVLRALSAKSVSAEELKTIRSLISKKKRMTP